MRRLSPVALLTGAVFVAAALSRSVWLSEAFFHPDESTVLWMALEAVRDPQIPDHGLISSLNVFQPPGLVWATMPWVALGGGRPELVIVGFALLNAAAIALLVATVARSWGLVYGAVLGTFLVVGPDAYLSTWVWHPSLYTAATAVMLAAGIRLRTGTAWWAVAVVAIPGLYALIHYSGFVLFGPALALLALSRRSLTTLAAPVLCGLALAVVAWGPFLAFETDREWLEIRTLTDATDTSTSFGETLDKRFTALGYAVAHLGESLRDAVLLTRVLQALVLVAFIVALIRRRFGDAGFALPAAMLVSGVVTQVLLAQGERSDVLLVWLVPLYALAAWGVVQLIELVRLGVTRRGVVPAITVAAMLLVLATGSVDLIDAIDATPDEQRLSERWRDARSDAPVPYDADTDPSANRFYLPCDPPYDWGSEIWYLREVLDPGTGIAQAAEGGAFQLRRGPPCPSREVLQER